MIYEVRAAPKSNFSFELAKSMKICSTSSNLKMFGTEEKTKNVDLEIKRSGSVTLVTIKHVKLCVMYLDHPKFIIFSYQTNFNISRTKRI